MNRRFDQIDAKFDAGLNHMDTKFAWMIGCQFATLLAAIGALLNAYFR